MYNSKCIFNLPCSTWHPPVQSTSEVPIFLVTTYRYRNMHICLHVYNLPCPKWQPFVEPSSIAPLFLATTYPPKNGEIALRSATNRGCVVKCVSQKRNWSNNKNRWYNILVTCTFKFKWSLYQTKIYVHSNLSKDGKTTRQHSKSAISPFVADQSAISPFLGGDTHIRIFLNIFPMYLAPNFDLPLSRLQKTLTSGFYCMSKQT